MRIKINKEIALILDESECKKLCDILQVLDKDNCGWDTETDEFITKIFALLEAELDE